MKKTSSHNLSKLISKKHQGEWVAISSDHKKVLGHSRNLSDLGKKVDLKRNVVVKATPLLTNYAPSSL